jgi:hypothetical protein
VSLPLPYAVDKLRATYRPRVVVDVVLLVAAVVTSGVLARGRPGWELAVPVVGGVLVLLDLLRVAVIMRSVRRAPVPLELSTDGIRIHVPGRDDERASWYTVTAVRLEHGYVARFVMSDRKDLTLSLGALDVDSQRFADLVASYSQGRHQVETV